MTTKRKKSYRGQMVDALLKDCVKTELDVMGLFVRNPTALPPDGSFVMAMCLRAYEWGLRAGRKAQEQK